MKNVPSAHLAKTDTFEALKEKISAMKVRVLEIIF